MKFIHKMVTTTFGAGYSPIAPGTAGAIVACGLYVLFMGKIIGGYQMSQLHFLTLTFLVTGAGIVSTNYMEKDWGKDPSKVVVDELVGMWITLLFVPFSWKYILVGLILFRFFDIAKPLFIRRLEKLPGGIGVMMDDVLAGIYANTLLQTFIHFGL